MVLDFANQADDIQKAFEPYYEATLLSEATDPNLLYDRQHELEEFGVFSEQEMEEFAALFFARKPQERLRGALRPIAQRAEEQLDDDQLKAFRSCLKDYARLYAFLSQILTFTDTDLEKLYVFARLLRRCLRTPKEELPRDIQEKIDMDALRIQPSFRGRIKLTRGGKEVDPASGGTEDVYGAGPEQVEPLSQIIEELNQRFGADLADEDRITLNRVMDIAQEDEALRQSVEVNATDNARLAFSNKITTLLNDIIDTNFKLFKRINDDRDFRHHLVASLFDDYRSRLENGGLTEADILKEIERGESRQVEFKSTLRFNIHTEEHDKRMTHAALKTIAAFQNSQGGTLYLGVADDGGIVGIERDGFPNDDKFLLHLNNVVKDWMGQAAATRIDPRIWMLSGKSVCRVTCKRSPTPVFLKFQGKESFYVRTGPSTEEMTPSETHGYISEHFPSA